MPERVDDLQYAGLKILQDTDGFCFGSDSVELANFAAAGRCRFAADLCAGTGAVAILLAAKTGAAVKAVELDPAAASLCRRSVEMNGMGDRVETLVMRAQDCPKAFGRRFDCVTCNPPYYRKGSGYVRPGELKARFEIELTLAELAAAAAGLLLTGGKFYTVYPAERLGEAVAAFTAARLEPKLLQILRPAENKPPRLFLLQCVRDGRPGLKILPERAIRTFDR